MQELEAARHFAIPPPDWDVMHVVERTRLVAAYRDIKDLEHISRLSENDLMQLRGSVEWVVLEDRHA